MIYKETFDTIQELNNFIVNESLTRSNIINIVPMEFNDWYELFYFKPSVLGDDE